MSFPNILHISEEEVFAQRTAEDVPVGLKAIVEDGRVFRSAECGALVLVVGSLNQAEAPSANWQDEAVATLDAGVTVLTGVGATTGGAAANLLTNGYVYTSNATTLPLMRIKSNTTITAGAATGTITLYTATPTAIAAANTISYFKNPWRDVVIHDSPATGVYTGVAKVAIAAASFGWLQTHGPCTALYSTTTTAVAAVNDPVCGAPGTDGAFQGLAAGTTETNPIIGYQLGMIEGNAEQAAIFLTIE